MTEIESTSSIALADPPRRRQPWWPKVVAVLTIVVAAVASASSAAPGSSAPRLRLVADVLGVDHDQVVYLPGTVVFLAGQTMYGYKLSHPEPHRQMEVGRAPQRLTAVGDLALVSTDVSTIAVDGQGHVVWRIDGSLIAVPSDDLLLVGEQDASDPLLVGSLSAVRA